MNIKWPKSQVAGYDLYGMQDKDTKSYSNHRNLGKHCHP